jgi:hypothetical protein
VKAPSTSPGVLPFSTTEETANRLFINSTARGRLGTLLHYYLHGMQFPHPLIRIVAKQQCRFEANVNSWPGADIDNQTCMLDGLKQQVPCTPLNRT